MVFLYFENVMTIVGDFKDKSGAWVKSFRENDKMINTRAGLLWKNIKHRTKHDKNYAGVIINGFKCFDSFVEWAHSEYGYLNKESGGNYWSLDKDLISFGNTVYCEDMCIFVPCYINGLYTYRLGKEKVSGLPIGVNLDRGKYKASCSVELKQRSLGTFSTPQEAHKAWQIAKASEFKRYIETDVAIAEHEKLVLHSETA